MSVPEDETGLKLEAGYRSHDARPPPPATSPVAGASVMMRTASSVRASMSRISVLTHRVESRLTVLVRNKPNVTTVVLGFLL